MLRRADDLLTSLKTTKDKLQAQRTENKRLSDRLAYWDVRHKSATILAKQLSQQQRGALRCYAQETSQLHVEARATHGATTKRERTSRAECTRLLKRLQAAEMELAAQARRLSQITRHNDSVEERVREKAGEIRAIKTRMAATERSQKETRDAIADGKRQLATVKEAWSVLESRAMESMGANEATWRAARGSPPHRDGRGQLKRGVGSSQTSKLLSNSILGSMRNMTL